MLILSTNKEEIIFRSYEAQHKIQTPDCDRIPLFYKQSDPRIFAQNENKNFYCAQNNED